MIRPKRNSRHTWKPVHPPRKAKDDTWKLQTISCAGCWCGKPYGHTWEGEEDGAPHPREAR